MSALHPHAPLLEARPHIFRSGRGRARGLVKHIKGKWKEWALALPRLHDLDPGLSVHLTAGGLLAHLPVCLSSFTFSFTHSLETLPPPPRLLWARPCAGVLALRVLMVSGEETGIR